MLRRQHTVLPAAHDEDVFCGLVGEEEGLTLVAAEGDEEGSAWIGGQRLRPVGMGGEQFTSHPSQRREGWGTREFLFG